MNSEPTLLDLLFSNTNPFGVAVLRDVLTLQASDTYALKAATVAMSFEADTVSGTSGLFSRDAMNDGGDGYHVSLYIKKGELIARFQNEDGQVLLRGGEVEAGTAYHTAISFGDGEVSLFVNGEVVANKPFDFTWETSPEAMQFGALGWKSASGSDAAQNVFDGKIADVEIYSGALSPAEGAEVAEEAEETPPQFVPEPAPENVVYADDLIEVARKKDVTTLDADAAYALEAATVAMSFEADTVSGTSGLFSRDAMKDGGDGYHVSLYIKKGELIARFQNEDGQVLLRGGEVEAGTAYHTAISFGDGEVSLFVNGEVVASRPFDFTWETSPEAMQFGALGWKSASGSDAVQNVFKGTLSQMSIYDSAVGDDTIAALADGVAPAPTAPAPAPVADDPQGSVAPPPIVVDDAAEEPEAPVAEEPVVEEPEAPVVEEPVVEEPEDPVVEEPVIEEPVAVVEEPEEPVVEEPVAQAPVEDDDDDDDDDDNDDDGDDDDNDDVPPPPEDPAAPRPDPVASESTGENGNVITLTNSTPGDDRADLHAGT